MNVVIIDFRASLNYTHHAQYMYSHVNFLKTHFTEMTITILLPIASEIDKKLTNFPNRIAKILVPTKYFPRSSFLRPLTFFTYILSRTHKFIFSKSNFLFNLIEFTASFVALLVLLLIKKDLILFPSACPNSLRLIRMLNILNFSTPIRIHFANPSSDEVILNEFFNSGHTYSNLKIAFSFETATREGFSK